MSFIQDTFKELGINGFRPWRDLVLVRTHPIPEKTGSIYLPTKLTSFYGELPHMQPIVATVLAAGPKATVVPGEVVAFMRLNFARWEYMADRTVVGWLNESWVMGHVELEEGQTFADIRMDSVAPRRLH